MDDAQFRKGVEKTLRRSGYLPPEEGGFFNEIGRGAKRNYWNAIRAYGSTLEKVGLGSSMRRDAENVLARNRDWEPNPEYTAWSLKPGNLGRTLANITDTALNLLPAIGATAVGGPAAGALTVAGLTAARTFGDSVDEFREAGMDETSAYFLGGLDAGVQGAIEAYLGVEKVALGLVKLASRRALTDTAKRFGKNRLVNVAKGMAYGGLSEGGEEVMQEYWHRFMRAAGGLGFEAPSWDEIKETFAGGAIPGAFIGGVSGGFYGGNRAQGDADPFVVQGQAAQGQTAQGVQGAPMQAQAMQEQAMQGEGVPPQAGQNVQAQAEAQGGVQAQNPLEQNPLEQNTAEQNPIEQNQPRNREVEIQTVQRVFNDLGVKIRVADENTPDAPAFVDSNGNEAAAILDRKNKVLWVHKNWEGLNSLEVFGHEYKHMLDALHPELAKQFDRVAQEYANKKGLQAYGARVLEYGSKIGTEEFNSDAFGSVWADPEFWQDLATKVDGKTFTRLKNVFLELIRRIQRALKSIGTPEAKEWFDNYTAIKNEVSSIMADVRNKNRGADYANNALEQGRNLRENIQKTKTEFETDLANGLRQDGQRRVNQYRQRQAQAALYQQEQKNKETAKTENANTENANASNEGGRFTQVTLDEARDILNKQEYQARRAEEEAKASEARAVDYALSKAGENQVNKFYKRAAKTDQLQKDKADREFYNARKPKKKKPVPFPEGKQIDWEDTENASAFAVKEYPAKENEKKFKASSLETLAEDLGVEEEVQALREVASVDNMLKLLKKLNRMNNLARIAETNKANANVYAMVQELQKNLQNAQDTKLLPGVRESQLLPEGKGRDDLSVLKQLEEQQKLTYALLQDWLERRSREQDTKLLPEGKDDALSLLKQYEAQQASTQALLQDFLERQSREAEQSNAQGNVQEVAQGNAQEAIPEEKKSRAEKLNEKLARADGIYTKEFIANAYVDFYNNVIFRLAEAKDYNNRQEGTWSEIENALLGNSVDIITEEGETVQVPLRAKESLAEYDPSKRASFKTFSSKYIENKISDLLRNQEEDLISTDAQANSGSEKTTRTVGESLGTNKGNPSKSLDGVSELTGKFFNYIKGRLSYKEGSYREYVIDKVFENYDVLNPNKKRTREHVNLVKQIVSEIQENEKYPKLEAKTIRDEIHEVADRIASEINLAKNNPAIQGTLNELRDSRAFTRRNRNQEPTAQEQTAQEQAAQEQASQTGRNQKNPYPPGTLDYEIFEALKETPAKSKNIRSVMNLATEWINDNGGVAASAELLAKGTGPIDADVRNAAMLAIMRTPEFQKLSSQTKVKVNEQYLDLGSKFGSSLALRRWGLEFLNTKEGVQAILNRLFADIPPVKREATRARILKDTGVDIDSLPDDIVNDKKRLDKILREGKAANATFGDKAYEFWINSILSGPTTHVVNTLGNFMNAGYELFVRKAVEAAINTVTRKKDAATFKEFKAMMKAIDWKSAVDALRNGFEYESINPYTGKYDYRNTAIGGKTGRAVRAPIRFLNASDQFAKAIFKPMEAASWATREGLSKGLNGKDLEAYVAEQLGNEDSAANQYGAMRARELAFQEEPGAAIKMLLRARESGGITGTLLRYNLPFITSPTNILRQGVRKSPLGVLNLAKEGIDIARGKAKMDNRFVQHAAEQVIAWGTLAYFMSLGGGDDDDGLPFITGSSPKYGSAEAKFKQNKIPPYSIRIGDTYYSYRRIEPLSTMLGTIADAVQRIRDAKSGKEGTAVLRDSIRGMQQMVVDKSFLAGLGEINKLVTDPERSLGQSATNFVSSWMPNAARQVMNAFNPNVSDYKNRESGAQWFKDEFMLTMNRMGIPKAAPKIDYFGREVTKDDLNDAAALGVPARLVALTPITPSKNMDDVERLMLNYNRKNPNSEYYPDVPNFYFTLGGKNLMFGNDQYGDYAKQSGRLARKMLQYYVDRGLLNVDSPTERDINIIKKVFSESRKMIRNMKIMKGEFKER